MFEDGAPTLRLTSRDFNGDRTGHRTTGQSSKVQNKNTLTGEKDSKCMHNVTLRYVWISVFWTLLRWSYHSIHWGHIFLCSICKCTLKYYYYYYGMLLYFF